jgi:hypothetical protein
MWDVLMFHRLIAPVVPPVISLNRLSNGAVAAGTSPDLLESMSRRCHGQRRQPWQRSLDRLAIRQGWRKDSYLKYCTGATSIYRLDANSAHYGA